MQVSFVCIIQAFKLLKDTFFLKKPCIGVNAYTTELVLIGSYDSIKQCSKANKIPHSIISQILNGKRLTYKGLTFFRLEEIPFQRISSKQRNMSKFYSSAI